jgi:hypothetical protein
MFCENCGKEIGDQSAFCGFCGATVGEAASEAASVPPQAPPQPQAPTAPQTPPAAPPPSPPGMMAAPPMGTPAAPAPYGPVKKRSPLPWILGGVGILAIIALVLVLVLVVFKGGDDASGPQTVVGNFYKSLEKQDVDMLLGTMEPEYVQDIKDILGTSYRQDFSDFFFVGIPEDLKVTINKYDTKVNGDQATVKVVDGTLTYTDENGEKVTEQASASEVDSLGLVKINGQWYISRATLEDTFGFDLNDLKDYYQD